MAKTLHMGDCPTQFTVAADGTRRWLRDVVIEQNPARVMLLIVDRDEPSRPVHGQRGTRSDRLRAGIAYAAT